MRLDSYLVEKGFFESRNRAALAIKEGQVSVAEKVVKKPSFSIEEGIEVSVQEAKFYLSRAAKKLEEYLKEYTLPIAGTRALDIGSSTGGFTQILLENGVESVACVDVGREQLHRSLREEERVSVFEGVDIRDFQPVCSDGGGYDLIVSDVSFISLLKIIDAVDRLASITATITLLFKPQFEVGIEAKRDSKGVVVDSVVVELAKQHFVEATLKLGWRVLDTRKSRVSGKEGNIEYFYTFSKERA